MKGKVRESDILDRLRDAVIEELARQAGTGRVSVNVTSDPKRADEVIVDDGVILATPLVRAVLGALKNSDEWRTAVVALRTESLGWPPAPAGQWGSDRSKR